MMPYDFVSSAQTAHLPGLRALEIMNPLSAEWQFLRPNLFFGLLNVVTRHAALGQLKGAFFDLGAVFEARDQKVEPAVKEKEKSETAPVRDIGAREAWHVGWALMGPRNVEHWSSDKTSSDRKAQADFFDAKGVCEQVLDGLSGIEPIWNAAQFTALDEALADPKVKAVIERDAPWIPLTLLHPGRSALVTLPGAPPGRIVGYVGELHPGAKRELLNLPAGLQLGVAVGELRWVPDLVAVLEKGQEAAEAFRGAVPRGKIQASRMLPVVERDVALVFTADTRAGEVAKTLKKAGGDELLDVECVDRFVLPDQKVSLAWRLWIQGKDKTLSDAEIQEIMGRALKSVQEKHGAIMRS